MEVSQALRQALHGAPGAKSLPVCIQGHCMSPAIHHRQRVPVELHAHPRPGDIVVFADHEGRLLAHRLLVRYRRRRRAMVLTAADHASRIDTAVPAHHVVGVVRDPGASPGPLLRLRCRLRGLAALGRMAMARLRRGTWR